MALHFSKEEFSSRKNKVLNSMQEQNLDALLMFRQESMYWLTGYDTFGYVFFQSLILDVDSVKDLIKTLLRAFIIIININNFRIFNITEIKVISSANK